MAVKIRPLGDRVLVKPIEETEVKKGSYDKQIANFVKEYQSIKIQLIENHKGALEVTNQLKAIEPAYQRISPLVDELVESVQVN